MQVQKWDRPINKRSQQTEQVTSAVKTAANGVRRIPSLQALNLTVTNTSYQQDLTVSVSKETRLFKAVHENAFRWKFQSFSEYWTMGVTKYRFEAGEEKRPGFIPIGWNKIGGF